MACALWRRCNPTVTNAGLSFVLSMGFTEVLLIGVDLGQKTAASHHSSLSVYHDLEKRSKGKIKAGGEELEQSLVPGNFGGEVYANWILSLSRNEMELLLSWPNPVGREHAVYNLNDGALINGAIPARYSDLNAFKPLADKPAIISAIKNRNFKYLEKCHPLRQGSRRPVSTELSRVEKITDATQENQHR